MENKLNFELLNENELFRELYKLRDDWNKENHLAHEYHEGEKHAEIKALLKNKFTVNAEVIANNDKAKGTVPYEVKIHQVST